MRRDPRYTWLHFAHAAIEETDPEKLSFLMQQLYAALDDEQPAAESKQIIHCPYCLLGATHRVMLRKLEGWFVCSSCGHTANPNRIDYKCRCEKCEEPDRAA